MPIEAYQGIRESLIRSVIQRVCCNHTSRWQVFSLKGETCFKGVLKRSTLERYVRVESLIEIYLHLKYVAPDTPDEEKSLKVWGEGPVEGLME